MPRLHELPVAHGVLDEALGLRAVDSAALALQQDALDVGAVLLAGLQPPDDLVDGAVVGGGGGRDRVRVDLSAADALHVVLVDLDGAPGVLYRDAGREAHARAGLRDADERFELAGRERDRARLVAGGRAGRVGRQL